MKPEWTLAIAAGGKSSRMGSDKSFVELSDKPLIQHVIERTRNLGQSQTILITNQPDAYRRFGLKTCKDVIPDKGSLGGIYTALVHSKTPYTLVVACDMPFLSSELLKYLIAQTDHEKYDVVAPRVDGYPQGLHAVYGQDCVEPIRKKLNQNRLKVIGFYNDVRVYFLDEVQYQMFDPEGRSFINVNTPEELEKAQQFFVR